MNLPAPALQLETRASHRLQRGDAALIARYIREISGRPAETGEAGTPHSPGGRTATGSAPWSRP